MLEDLYVLLRRRSTPNLDLAALFQSILNQEGTKEQRRRFGHKQADEGRKLIVKTIGDYARTTHNWQLLRLLDRFRDFADNKADPNIPAPSAAPTPSAGTRSASGGNAAPR